MTWPFGILFNTKAITELTETILKFTELVRAQDRALQQRKERIVELERELSEIAKPTEDPPNMEIRKC